MLYYYYLSSRTEVLVLKSAAISNLSDDVFVLCCFALFCYFLLRALGFTPGFWWVRVVHLFRVLYICVVFVFILCCQLPVSLDLPFVITASVFSNVYFGSAYTHCTAPKSCNYD